MSKSADVSYEMTLLVRDTCLCLHIQRAARALARRFDEALRPLGLTNGQFSLMMSLNRPEPPRIGSVAALLAMDRTTLTAALKPLERRGLVEVPPDQGGRRSRRLTPTPARRPGERRGWVEVTPAKGDGRSGRLTLTPAGRTLLASAVPIWHSTHVAL